MPKYKCPYGSNHLRGWGRVPDIEIIKSLPRVKIASLDELDVKFRFPHIRVNNFYGWKPNFNGEKQYFVISIDEEPKVLGTPKIRDEHLKELLDFIKDNLKLLLLVWHGNASSTSIEYMKADLK
jgi:hypothetical protein